MDMSPRDHYSQPCARQTLSSIWTIRTPSLQAGQIKAFLNGKLLGGEAKFLPHVNNIPLQRTIFSPQNFALHELYNPLPSPLQIVFAVSFSRM